MSNISRPAIAGRPAITEVFGHAYGELNEARWHLSEAASWMRSDWSDRRSLTDAEADARSEIFRVVGDAKAAIDRAKEAVDRARDIGEPM